MKTIKLIAAAILMIGFSSVWAQNKAVTLGVRAGINSSNFSGDLKDTKSINNLMVGVTADFALPGDFFYVMTGVDFHTKGAKNTTQGIESKYRPMYLQAPVDLGYKIALADNFKFVLNAGPYVAYGIGGKKETGDLDKKLFSDKILKRFDFGVNAGIGIELWNVCVSTGYDWGLSNISDIDNVKIRNRSLYATVGLKF